MVLASQDDYKSSKESFVSGMTGSTVLHVNMISFVALVCVPHIRSPHFCLAYTEISPQVIYRTPLHHPLSLPTTQIPPIPL